ncbi:MAG: RNA-guided pseudouridylation complex pseudouridine synthase subunit Cbf5 [Nanoarchaeota archaeon]|nr:RNA-guided pseudouridylation complex pseudouridine synthase subunit Cbf5 [Nanoarchaeota archaeon]
MEKQKSIQEILDFCIINVDKPAGYTSFEVCEKIRKILDAKKAGHFGTLDPMVTGVLPIAINRATRLSNYFMKKDKIYIGKMLLHSDIDEERLKKEMNNFLGKIIQKPPKKSRVKRVERERYINEFRIMKKQGKIVEFYSNVEAGTYIRKLIHDLGKKIGGAHMIELRRIKAGIFEEKDSHLIKEIEEAFDIYKLSNNPEFLNKILIPAEIIKNIIPEVKVKESSLRDLFNGKPLFIRDMLSNLETIENKFPYISVFCEEKFIGVYKVEKNLDIIAKPDFVLN